MFCYFEYLSNKEVAQKFILGDILPSIPESYYYQPQYIDEINTTEKLRLEKILGRKISREAFVT